jgi:replicative DNA helicase
VTGRPALDPRWAFLGTVLHSDTRTATGALRIVYPDDLADPRLALVASIAGELAAEGIPPDPVAVLARARRDARVTGAEATHSLTLLLVDLSEARLVAESVWHYAGAVITDALRRRVAEAGVRFQQAAAPESLSSLLALVDAETDAVWALARRVAAAEQDRPPAAEVGPEVRREVQPDTARPGRRTA